MPDKPKRHSVECVSGDRTFYPELIPQTVGAHGHEVQAWQASIRLKAYARGGLTKKQALMDLSLELQDASNAIEIAAAYVGE